MQRRLFLATILLPGLAACGRRRPIEPITVFFDGSSAQLDNAASYTIAQAAEQARARPSNSVRVLGFAAPGATSASAEFTRTLANTRAQAVREALIAYGIARSRVTLGERAIVPYELAAAESRRVEIAFGR